MKRCESDDSDGNRTDGSSARTLLFSAQLFLSRVQLQLPQTCGSNLLIGFQLLQYEIVLFDAARVVSSDDNADNEQRDDKADRHELVLEHGKSCLFDAIADDLAIDLQRADDAPLALLVMQQEHGKARLVAFASIPIELHAGLVHTATSVRDDGERINTTRLSDAMHFRVCEWASSSGSWQLRDHANRVVGIATGAFTLSCLGRALAPHIAKAIGLRVDLAASCNASAATAPPPASALDSALPVSATATGDTAVAVAPSVTSLPQPSVVVVDKLVVPQRVDTAVQCNDDDMRIAADTNDARASRKGAHAGPRSNARVLPGITLESMSALRNNRMRSPVRSTSTSSHARTEHRTERQRDRRPAGVAKEPALFVDTLPPPLFFHKPAAQAKR